MSPWVSFYRSKRTSETNCCAQCLFEPVKQYVALITKAAKAYSNRRQIKYQGGRGNVSTRDRTARSSKASSFLRVVPRKWTFVAERKERRPDRNRVTRLSRLQAFSRNEEQIKGAQSPGRCGSVHGNRTNFIGEAAIGPRHTYDREARAVRSYQSPGTTPPFLSSPPPPPSSPTTEPD